MNYIHRLKRDNDTLQAALRAARAEIAAFREHLHGAKFVGVESDGGRKDWISTGDVLARLGVIDAAIVDEIVKL